MLPPGISGPPANTDIIHSMGKKKKNKIKKGCRAVINGCKCHRVLPGSPPMADPHPTESRALPCLTGHWGKGQAQSFEQLGNGFGACFLADGTFFFFFFACCLNSWSGKDRLLHVPCPGPIVLPSHSPFLCQSWENSASFSLLVSQHSVS